MRRSRREFLLSVPSAAAPFGGLLNAAAGKRSRQLVLEAPIERWDEAIPLGNGLTGGLLWGGGQTIRLSLDRGDLWDLRTPDPIRRKDWTWATIERLVAEKNQREIVTMFDSPYNQVPYATKVPAGRLEVTLGGGSSIQSFRLDMERAVGIVALGKGEVEAIFSAVEPVAMLRVPGEVAGCRILPPASVRRLGYEAAVEGREGELQWYLQTAALGLKYAVVIGTRASGDSVDIAIAITSTKDGPDPVAEGKARVERALATGYRALAGSHAQWWERFWRQSQITVPDSAVQLHYDLVQYFYGAASRRGAPPIPLQGVWTADEGNLPPWHGDYHHDLNTQLTYWAYLASGHFEEGAAFLDFMWDLLPEHTRFARDFYGTPGAAVPGVMTLDGKPMGGWSQYSLSPINGAWVAQSFYRHWRYTMDRKFLAERAYPYCEAIATCLEALLKPGSDGTLKLPLSTSPEIHDNKLNAWLTPNTNFDQALLMWLFGALEEMSPAADRAAMVPRWRRLRERLGQLASEGEDGPLRLSPDESLVESHRHFSHLMAIHPLGLVNIEKGEQDRRIIRASLKQLDQLGTRAWCGYSFSWLAAMAARVGEPERALRNLQIYLEAFISRNGFHLNGDYQGKGYAAARYRPFTLEGNFAAAQAVQEMLLESWGGVVRIFPAVPGGWADVSFRDLRAEGGYTVSATRRNGATASISIRSAETGVLRLRDPFGGRKAVWNRHAIKRNGSDYEVTLTSGQTLIGHASGFRD